MKRPMTNTEVVNHLMNFSNHGAMSQLVIMTGIENYAKAVVKAGPGCLGSASAMIDEGSWIATCEEIAAALADREGMTIVDREGELEEADLVVRLDFDHLQMLREAAMQAVKILEAGDTSATHDGLTNCEAIRKLHQGLLKTSGAVAEVS